jgi:serine/threonine protein kinase
MRMLSLLRSLDHPNIVRLLASYTFREEHSLLFPQLKMDLAQFLKLEHRFGEFRWNSTFHLALYGLASALETIHAFRLDPAKHDLDLLAIGYHHDFRPANILVDERTFVLSDFGLGGLDKPDKEVEKEWFPTPGNYSAPECEDQGFKQQMVSPMIDVWAFGCLLSDVLTYMRMGPGGVQHFREVRREKVPGKENWDSSRFYFSREKLKSSVLQWLQSLESEEHQLQGAIEVAVGALEPDPNQRLSISSARSKLAIPSLRALAEQVLTELQKLLQERLTKHRLGMRVWWAHMQIYLFSKVLSPSLDNESHFARNSQRFDQSSTILMALLRTIDMEMSGTGPEGGFESDFEGLTKQLASVLPHAIRNAAEAQWFLALSSNAKNIARINSQYSESHHGKDETTENMRKQLRHILKQIKNDEGANAHELYHNHQDLKYLESYGEHEYGFFKGQRVLVESIYFKPEADSVPPSERSRVMQLKAKGFQMEPRPRDLRILKCIGFVDEIQRSDGRNGYSFMYELPQEVIQQKRFRGMSSLFDVITRTMKSTSDQPCPQEKYQLASALASFIRELHDVKCLHESFNTRNIVFSKDPTVIGEGLDDHDSIDGVSAWSKPYVIGLQKSRPEGQEWSTEGPVSEQKYQKDEQHPAYRDGHRFLMEYEYYSFGLVLFQIGVWSTLQTMSDKPARFREQPGHKYFKKLRTYTGPEYRDIVRVCLDGTLERNPDQNRSINEQNTEVFQVFIQKVLIPLHRLSA